MTDTRPLADVMFLIFGGILIAPALVDLVGFPLACLATALVYALYINTVTIFRLPVSTALVAAGVVFGLSHWLVDRDRVSDSFELVMTLVASVHVLQAWRK
ncbi:MAG: hypothetical protein JNL25_14330 [Rhodospirillaceae bacterium]|nr:hypothetical protein [Rhodospirillaceae bacterium]